MSDFFISYTGEDVDWARWVAATLEEAGFSTIYQDRDFRPGSNFVLEMHKAAQDCDRTIALLSPGFLSAAYTSVEWAAAIVADPRAGTRKLLPVRVRECSPAGLLGSINYVDLVGLEPTAAKERLLAAVRPEPSEDRRAAVFPAPSPNGKSGRRWVRGNLAALGAVVFTISGAAVWYGGGEWPFRASIVTPLTSDSSIADRLSWAQQELEKLRLQPVRTREDALRAEELLRRVQETLESVRKTQTKGDAPDHVRKPEEEPFKRDRDQLLEALNATVAAQRRQIATLLTDPTRTVAVAVASSPLPPPASPPAPIVSETPAVSPASPPPEPPATALSPSLVIAALPVSEPPAPSPAPPPIHLSAAPRPVAPPSAPSEQTAALVPVPPPPVPEPPAAAPTPTPVVAPSPPPSPAPAAEPPWSTAAVAPPVTPEPAAQVGRPDASEKAPPTDPLVASLPPSDVGAPSIDNIAEAVRLLFPGYPCSVLDLNIAGRTGIVAGFVSSAEELSQLKASIASFAGSAIRPDIQVLEKPFCGVAKVLHETSRIRVPDITFNKPTKNYVDGEKLVVRVRTPKAGYLYVDYIDKAGTVVHMLPRPGRESNRVQSGQVVTFGELPADERVYEIGEPYGSNMISVVISAQPLFQSVREEVEPSFEQYVGALESALATDKEAIGGMVLFDTQPR